MKELAGVGRGENEDGRKRVSDRGNSMCNVMEAGLGIISSHRFGSEGFCEIVENGKLSRGCIMKGFVADFDISSLSVAALVITLGGSDLGSQLSPLGKTIGTT